MSVSVNPVPTVAFEPRPASFDGFVRAQDARLVDGGGRELLLRGVGLGNWLLPEGYMWGFGPGAESPREIDKAFQGPALARISGIDSQADQNVIGTPALVT